MVRSHRGGGGGGVKVTLLPCDTACNSNVFCFTSAFLEKIVNPLVTALGTYWTSHLLKIVSKPKIDILKCYPKLNVVNFSEAQ